MKAQPLGRRGRRLPDRGPAELRRKPRGLTLLELLIALTLSAVTAALVVPAFGRMAAQNQLALSSNQVLMAAITARQTAVSRNLSVTLCAGRIEGGCHDDWARREWIVFEDPDQDGELDSDEVVKLADHLPSSSKATITGNGPFRNAVVFKPSGAAETSTGAFAAGRLRVCVGQPIRSNATDLVLIGSGRIEPERRDFSGACPAP